MKLLSLLALLVASSLYADQDLSELKLQGRWPVGSSPSGAQQGYAVALSDKWALSGAPFATPGATMAEGVVHVFNAKTGAWVRMLRRPATEVGNKHFGRALAISGDLAVICGDGNMGSPTWAYVYNLATGALVRLLHPSYSQLADNFGNCVSISGNRVFIGASDYGAGVVYLFDLATGGFEKYLLFPSDSASFPSMQFGTSLAIDGNLALIGAPAHGAGRGAAYVIDLTSRDELAILVPSASGATDAVGKSVALSQGIAVMGAPYHSGNQGAVFTIDLRTGTEHTLSSAIAFEYMGFNPASLSASNGMLLVGVSYAFASEGTARLYDLASGVGLRRVTPVDITATGSYGFAVAMSGNNAMIGRYSDPSPAPAAGAAYLFTPLTTASPVRKVAARGDFAPGASDASFNVLGDAFINATGAVAFNAKLSGAGSHGGKDAGVWTTLRSGGALSLSAKSDYVDGAAVVLSVGTPVINNASTAYYPGIMKTGVGGITPLNNRVIYAENGIGSGYDIATNDSISMFGNAKLNGFTEFVQSAGAAPNNWASSCLLRREAITNTDATNDSGIIILDLNYNLDGVREGALIKPANTTKYGQFTGRVSYLINSVIYSAATASAPSSNAVIMQKVYGAGETVVATKGAQAPPLNGPIFSAFIGETADYYERVTYRATLTGSGVTGANNEGLWTHTMANVNAVAMRKGPNAKLLGGLTIKRFVQFWAVSGVSDQVVALVQLGGTGVNSANDQALIMVQEDDSWNILMREGQDAPGCHPARIGVISRVEMDPFNGRYAVLTTLAGAPSGTEQALFTGALYLGDTNVHSTLRRPMLFLRKGSMYDNQPSKIKSLSLPTTNITVSGAGGTGRGRAVSSNGDIAITIEFDNKVRQIMKGHL